jgi:hypothetical protein
MDLRTIARLEETTPRSSAPPPPAVASGRVGGRVGGVSLFFGEFELDASTYKLLRAGRQIPLQPTVFDAPALGLARDHSVPGRRSSPTFSAGGAGTTSTFGACSRASPTRLYVFSDHGFTIDRSGSARSGGASPEEVLVGAFALLVGDVH